MSYTITQIFPKFTFFGKISNQLLLTFWKQVFYGEDFDFFY